MSVEKIAHILDEANAAPEAKNPILICFILILVLLVGVAAFLALAATVRSAFEMGGWARTYWPAVSITAAALVFLISCLVRLRKVTSEIDQEWNPPEDI